MIGPLGIPMAFQFFVDSKIGADNADASRTVSAPFATVSLTTLEA